MGHPEDSSGLIYMRARYYDSSIGRFLSEDPAMDGINWYLYCNGNPVMSVDYTGKFVGSINEPGEATEISETTTGASGVPTTLTQASKHATKRFWERVAPELEARLKQEVTEMDLNKLMSRWKGMNAFKNNCGSWQYDFMWHQIQISLIADDEGMLITILVPK